MHALVLCGVACARPDAAVDAAAGVHVAIACSHHVAIACFLAAETSEGKVLAVSRGGVEDVLREVDINCTILLVGLWEVLPPEVLDFLRKGGVGNHEALEGTVLVGTKHLEGVLLRRPDADDASRKLCTGIVCQHLLHTS